MNDAFCREFLDYLDIAKTEPFLWKPDDLQSELVKGINERFADPARRHQMILQLIVMSRQTPHPKCKDIQWCGDQMLYHNWEADSVCLGTNSIKAVPGFKIYHLQVIGDKPCWIESREVGRSYEACVVFDGNRGQLFDEIEHLCAVGHLPFYIGKTRNPDDDKRLPLYTYSVMYGTTQIETWDHVNEFEIVQGLPCYVVEKDQQLFVRWGGYMHPLGNRNGGGGDIFAYKDGFLCVCRWSAQRNEQLVYITQNSIQVVATDASVTRRPVVVDGELAYATQNNERVNVFWGTRQMTIPGFLRPWDNFNFGDPNRRNRRDAPLLLFCINNQDETWTIWVNLKPLTTWSQWDHFTPEFDKDQGVLTIKPNSYTVRAFEPQVFNLEELNIL